MCDIILKFNKKFIKISCIVHLLGLSDNGECNINEIKDKYHKCKTIFKYFTWHTDIPLFTNDTVLNVDRYKIKQWIFDLKVPMYNVRGDIGKILLEIKEILK